jgi:poly-gamma-glutamate capsule biosynthesis protein CapA/YwtB (metallophosphatase superfamily)
MRVALLGDVYISDEARPDRRAGIFENVRSRIGSDTLLVANVEFAITEKSSPHLYKWATLCSSPAVAGELASISVAVLANNHAGDAGLEGLGDTVASLQRVGVRSVGYGKTLEQSLEPCLLKNRSGTIGLVALCCLTTNSQSIATHTDPGVPPISIQTLRHAINKARREADAVIVVLHWGCEQTPYPVPDQVRLGRFAIDAGADAVVGCHAHVIQTYEQYKGRWIFHGLGNFFFDPVNAKYFENGRLIADVPIEHKVKNRESLVPVFELREKRLDLADLFVTAWDGKQAPVSKELAEASTDLGAINLRLRRWAARHRRGLRSDAEPQFRCSLHNGIVAYHYAGPPIHKDWTVRGLMKRVYRRARREAAKLRKAT